MKPLIFVALALISLPAAAVEWPSGDCAGTLQACIDANASVDIVTDGPINENIVIVESKTLRAAAGYKPVFSAGRSVSATFNMGGGSMLLRIEGLTLERGRIRVVQLSGTVTAYIIRNTVLDTFDGESAIVAHPTVSDPFTAYIHYNQVSHLQTATHPSAGGAIQFIATNNTAATTQIYGNTVTARGEAAYGIWILNEGTGQLQADVIGNEIKGGAVGSIYMTQQDNGGANLTGRIVSNSVTSMRGQAPAYGIGVQTDGASSEFDIFNNTVTHAQNGIRAVHTSGTQNGTLANNLVAYNTGLGLGIDAGSSISNRYNLVHGNGSNSYSPGINTITSAPHLLSAGYNNRLRDTSPAIDAADASVLFAVTDLPYSDADGMYRYNGTNLDIGAYESGRHQMLHRASDMSASHITILDAPWLDGFPGRTLFTNPVYTEMGLIDNPHPLGVYYALSTWRIFNQDLINIAPNAAFNVFHAGSNAADYLHSHSGSGSATTTLDRVGLNGEPQKILAVTQNWNGQGAGIYNAHYIGLVYVFGQWGIVNRDLAEIPDGADFNVFYQDPSANAFEHVVTPGTLRFSTVTSEIDHPLLNGNECAQFTYTYNDSQGLLPDQDFIAWYRSTRQRWHIGSSSAAVPEDAAFHIIVDPQHVADCTDIIFQDPLGD